MSRTDKLWKRLRKCWWSDVSQPRPIKGRDKDKDEDYAWLTPFLLCVVQCIRRLNLPYILTKNLGRCIGRKLKRKKQEREKLVYRAVDIYTLLRFVVGIGVFWILHDHHESSIWMWVFLVFALLSITQNVAAHVGIMLVDRPQDTRPASPRRTAVFAILGFMHLVLTYAIVYFCMDRIWPVPNTALLCWQNALHTSVAAACGVALPTPPIGRPVFWGLTPVFQLLTSVIYLALVVGPLVQATSEKKGRICEGSARSTTKEGSQ